MTKVCIIGLYNIITWYPYDLTLIIVDTVVGPREDILFHRSQHRIPMGPMLVSDYRCRLNTFGLMGGPSCRWVCLVQSSIWPLWYPVQFYGVPTTESVTHLLSSHESPKVKLYWVPREVQGAYWSFGTPCDSRSSRLER